MYNVQLNLRKNEEKTHTHGGINIKYCLLKNTTTIDLI